MAIPFDIDRLESSGGPVPIVEDVFRSPNPAATTATANYGFSREGMLAYVPALPDSGAQRTLVWVDRQGREAPIAAEPRPYGSLQLSPDGRQVVMDVRDPENSDIWIYDLGRETLRRFTFDAAVDQWPRWTPDGERIIFSSDRDGAWGLFAKMADGTGQVERLTTSAGGGHSGGLQLRARRDARVCRAAGGNQQRHRYRLDGR